VRYWIGSVALALLALPLSASAQGTDKGWVEESYPELAPRESPRPPPRESAPKGKGTTPEPSIVQEPALPPEPAPGEPALELTLDDAGVEAVPSPRTVDGHTLEEMDRRVRRARIGLLSTTGVLVAGVVFVASWGAAGCFDLNINLSFKAESSIGFSTKARSISEPGCGALGGIGFISILGGAAGMIANGILLGVRKRKLRELQQAHYGRRRQVQWELARSRLVF
jgi:hypothetical protein